MILSLFFLNHGYREHFDGCQIRRGYGGMDEEALGLKSTNRQLQNSHRDVNKVQYKKMQ